MIVTATATVTATVTAIVSAIVSAMTFLFQPMVIGIVFLNRTASSVELGVKATGR